MISDTLISDDVWSEAPEDAREAFLFIVLAAHKRLKELGESEAERGQFTYSDWRSQYVWEICAVAEELEIPGLPAASQATQSASNLNEFDARLARLITKIKASKRSLFKLDSVSLANITKNDIRECLEELRFRVNSSNLSDSLKASLHRKIDDVEAELDKKRASLRPFWSLAGAITLAGAGIGAFADLPDAISTVQSIVEKAHADKTREEENLKKFAETPALDYTAPKAISHSSD